MRGKKFLMLVIGILFLNISLIVLGNEEEETLEIKKGIEYYEMENYDSAENIWKPLADKGNKVAQYNMGLLYKVQEKYDLSEKYYLIAADRGDHLTQNNLAIIYEEQGRYRLAYKYYKMSERQGYTFAKDNLKTFKKKLLNLSWKERILFYK